MRGFHKRLGQGRAAMVVEFGLIAALVSVAVIAMLGVVGGHMPSTFVAVGGCPAGGAGC